MKRIRVFVWAVAVLAAIAISGTLAVMRRDGVTVEELWQRKKEFVRTASPEAGDAMDQAEKAVRP